MTRRQRKLTYYILEGTSSFSTAYHLNYLFFLLHTEFGFGNKENLMVSALHGGVYMLTAWWSGRVSRQLGCLAAMRLGFAGMALAQTIGLFVHTAPVKLALLAVWTFSMTFIWPAIQSLVSRNEDDSALPGVVGLYNCIWAGASGLAYFLGGAIFEGAGHQSIYWLPLTIHGIQFAFVSW
ncbi:MAG TPA: hypothetical protein VHH73_05185, partial [Verrucomicrobiae bacterium]|nr:hypothetical protein [Verrucomicrobiae bacterium]